MSEDGCKDCPQCGMERIPMRVRLCTACEVEQKWAKDANAYAEACRQLIADRDTIRREYAAALGHVVEVLEALAKGFV